MFLPLLLFSSAYATQVEYFINCGSSSNATVDSRTFTGDINSGQFSFSGHRSKALKDRNQSEYPFKTLYQTARVFKNPSTYDFNIPQNGTYILRFHFYAFLSSPELANARFNVSASGHLLLLDFNGKNASNSPVLKEFILTINNHTNDNTGKFQIYFVPENQGKSSSLAFINAIEILSTTKNLTEVTRLDHVTPSGRRGVYNGQKSKVLETIYRVNVGESEVIPMNDSRWMTWITDDRYLINRGAAENFTYQSTIQHYDQVTDDYAPDIVYGTAKILKDSTSFNVIPNLTWQFNVNKGTRYFLRVHFCDIIAPSLGPNMFNLYIYSKFVEMINPSDISGHLAAPFYKDYIVESDDLGFMNISLGPLNKTYLFLNGLEIMEVKNGTSPEPPNNNVNASHLALVASLVGSSVALILILVAVFLLHRKKRKAKPVEAFEWAMLTPDRLSSHASNISNLRLGLKIPFIEIQQVTNNFEANLIIGEGGFGKVYKGTLKNGIKVAVKRSNPDHGQGLPEFQTEIMVLSKIRHRHLVSLIGYCHEDGEMILVYEFMEKGTLRDHLYGSRGTLVSSNHVGLSWEQRLEICIGAAKGLHYLHTGTHQAIIHRDIKSTNILLDEHYVAKVADFGLSRLELLDQTHVSTDVKGTLGYLDPEYFTCLQLTEKSDVYSFGIVLLEVLCARPVIDRSLPKEEVNLGDWAMACYKEGKLEKIIDPLIGGEINLDSLMKFCETTEKCLKDYAVERPPMSDVLWDLEYALQLQKMAGQKQMQGDSMSMTDASLNLPLPAVVQRFPSQSYADEEDDVVLLDTSTGEVFSHLGFEDNTGR